MAENESVVGEIKVSASAIAYSQEYEWTIDHDCISGKIVGDVLKSPVFFTNNICNTYQWQLWFYPNGVTQKFKNIFVLYLCFLSDDEMKVNASFEIINSQGEVINKSPSKIFRIFSVSSETCGKPLFITKGANHIFHDGKLTIAIEMISCKKEDQNDIKTILTEQHRLRSDFEKLLDDEEFNDVEFAIGDKELRAHKSILGKRSCVFAAMFTNEMREKREKKVVITDVKHEVFLEMLRYIYSGKVNGIENMAGELLAAADKYSLDGLKLMCAKVLSCNVNADNVLDNLRLADLHNAESLKDKAIEFIVTHPTGIVDKPEFRQLPYNIVCEVCSALSNMVNSLLCR